MNAWTATNDNAKVYAKVYEWPPEHNRVPGIGSCRRANGSRENRTEPGTNWTIAEIVVGSGALRRDRRRVVRYQLAVLTFIR